MAARVLPADTLVNVWSRYDFPSPGIGNTDNFINGSGNYTVWADGVLWDNTNSKAIPPEHATYQAFFATPRG